MVFSIGKHETTKFAELKTDNRGPASDIKYVRKADGNGLLLVLSDSVITTYNFQTPVM